MITIRMLGMMREDVKFGEENGNRREARRRSEGRSDRWCSLREETENQARTSPRLHCELKFLPEK
jgi:hypothetical protein